MNIINILDEIEKVDTDVSENLNSRRDAMKSFLSFGKKVAVASVPLGLGSMFNSASAQTASAELTAMLQFVLKVKHFKVALMTKGLATVNFDGKNGTTDKPAIEKMLAQNKLHIKFLQDTIGPSAAKAQTDYNYTAGTVFPDILSSDNTFIKVLQGITDTLIRAIKGGSSALLNGGENLTDALGIHSVEARHSAKLRMMRYLNGYSPLSKPWVSGNDLTTDTIGDKNYEGEDNVMQAGVTVTGIGGTDITAAQASEAFDEPLTGPQATAALTGFNIKF